MSSNYTCPTTPGLTRAGGVEPELDWQHVKEHPGTNWHIIGWLICLGFLAVTWIVAIVIVTRHLRNYYEPHIQRHKLRVLLFPPVYATLSWFSYLRYDYSTTIDLFATLFEAFAVFNLYEVLQAYLQPYRDECEGMKEPKDVKVLWIYKLHITSMWGMHNRIITDILVFQYPIWSIISAIAAIASEATGRYCDGVYSFKGAYVYLTIIDFGSLSLILTALLTYLEIFNREWKRGNIRAHGMFWCVKGPIMVNFYFGELLLSVLTTAGVVKGSANLSGGIVWSADAVKNGIYVIIVCFVMFVDSFLMLRYFGPHDNIQRCVRHGKPKEMGYWAAFWDGYISYIPEFLYSVMCCGMDSYKLMKKRKALKKRKQLEKEGRLSSATTSNMSWSTSEQTLNGKVDDKYSFKMEALDKDHQAYQPPTDPPVVSVNSPQNAYKAPNSPSATQPSPYELDLPYERAYQQQQQNVYQQDKNSHEKQQQNPFEDPQ